MGINKKTIDVIPAIDLIDGKCVRLTQGDYDRKVEYNSNPLEVAKRFEDMGFRRLHLVDLDGAKQKKVVNDHVLEAITSKTNLVVDFGGGVQSNEDLNKVLSKGAAYVTCGSIAVKEEELFDKWIQAHGADKFILAADVKFGKVAVSGWLETSEIEIIPFLDKYIDKGIKNILCTDISKDGMLAGPSMELYQLIMQRFPDIYLIASGGVGHIGDIVWLNDTKIPAVVVGKALYENKIKIEKLAEDGFIG